MHVPREVVIQQTGPSPIDGSTEVGNNSSAWHAEAVSCCYQATWQCLSMSELLNEVSNSVNRNNAIAKKHNVILNNTKLPATTVKPNQLRFRWVKLESIRGHPSTNRISTISQSLQHNLFRANIHVTIYLQIISIGMGQQTKTTNQLYKIRGIQ